MIRPMRLKRLSVVMLVLSGLIFGVSYWVGSSRAGTSAITSYRCSAADKQFLDTVSSNLMQLGYWSDSLVHRDATPDVVESQARDEARQVSETQPQDRTLHATRDLLKSMFDEYGKAVSAGSRGKDPLHHMQNAWRLAGSVHNLLLGAKDGLAAQGCDVSPLLVTST